MHKLSPDQLSAPAWHGFQEDRSKLAKPSRASAVEIAVPLLVIAILAALGYWVMAGIVLAIAGTVTLIRAASPAGRRTIDKGLSCFAEWAGRVIAWVLLAVPFFGIMTLVRVLDGLTGNDPLALRERESTTFWRACDSDRRRRRFSTSMFCSERLTRTRVSLIPLAVLCMLLVGATEIGLRIIGYGTPILYIQDPDIGYYPAPNQKVRYPGRVISINEHSMRAPPISPQKPTGKVRILMIGDSTLAGTKVANEDLYSSLLQKKLDARSGGPKFEVFNMGVNAWGPHHERAFLQKFGNFDADLVVICGPVANCFRPRYGMERLPFSPVNSPPRLAIEQIAYELIWRFRESTLGAPPWALEGPYQDAQARQGTAAYVEMAKKLQAEGVEVMMEMLPGRQATLSAMEDPFSARLFEPIRKQMEEIGVPIHCAGPIFEGAKDASKIYHDGVHFDTLGHELYADHLVKQLTLHSERVKTALGE
jgi:lysophospholipase L1-like esterase